MEIRRNHILEDSLSYLSNECIVQELKQKFLKVIFVNEPAIDEGGVKKEFFRLLLIELFNPMYDIFMYNSDNRLYYFNGKSFELTHYFELIGTLMALAPQNQVILDIPIISTCYKILLDQKIDLEDLKEWQPDVYQSFKYILNYKDEDTLEDILLRTFTIDYENFNEKITENLKKDGDKIYVTKKNRQEFVDLYIQHLFLIQCKEQIDSFKRGFYKLFDQPMLRLLYTPEELEQFVCGSKDLNFNQLKTVTKYIKPLGPKYDLINWFWNIVLNDFTDQ